MQIKNKISILLVLAATIFGAFVATFDFAQADPIKQISVSAYLIGSQNKEVDNGDYEVRFAFYKTDRTAADPYPSNADSASRVWEETQKVKIVNGVMSAYLGSVAPFPDTLSFNDGDYFLGIRIGTDSEMVPRKKIAAAPTAVNSLFLRGATIGTGEGNIPLLEKGGKINVKNLPTGKTSSTLVLGNDSRLNGEVTVSGDYDYLSASGMEITLDQINLGTDVSGTLNIANGGTGLSTIADGSILYANAVNSLTALTGTAADDGEMLTFNWNGGSPTLSWDIATGSFTSFDVAGDAGTNQTISNGNTLTITGGTNISTATGAIDTVTINLDTTLTGVTWNGNAIGVVYGGTGIATYTTGDILYSSAANTLAKLAIGTDGQILRIVGGIPDWESVSYVGSHNLLSLVHPDTTAASPLPGDLITGVDTGGGVMKWQRQSIGAADRILMVNGTGNGIEWSPSTDITALGTVATGTWNANVIADAFVSNALTVSGGTISASDITLIQSVNPTPTAEGRIEWDTDNDRIIVGDGAGQAIFYSGLGAGGVGGSGTAGYPAYWQDANTLTAEQYLDVTRGGTGVGTFTTNGVLYGNGTGDILATSAGTGGQLLIASNTGVPTFRTMSGDVNIDYLGAATIQSDSVTLTTDTAGNYVASVATGSGLTGGAAGSEGAALTLALGNLSSNWTQTGAFDIILANAGSELQIMESTGATFYGIFDVTDLAANRTYTFPDQSGTVCTTGSVCSGYQASGNYLTTTTNFGGDVSGTYNTIAVADDSHAHTAGTLPATISYLGSSIDLTSEITGILPVANGGTGLAAYTAGDMLYYSSGTALTKLAVGADGQVLVISAGIPTWSSTAPGAAHNLLSSSHADTTTGTVVRGDIVTGQGVSPTWAKLALGTSGQYLRSDGTDAAWSGILEGDLPATLTRDSEWDTQGEAETIWGATLATDSELSTHAALAAGVHGAAGTIVGTSDAQTLTNKTLSTGSTWNGNIITTAYGGSGIDGSAAGNGTLLIGNGTGYTLAALTQGSGITVTNGAGSISIASTLGTSVETAEITDSTILEADLSATNAPSDAYILSYDLTSGGFTWIANTGGTGSSKWTDAGTFTYLTATGDDLVLGGTTTSSPFFFDTSAAKLTLGFDTASGSLALYSEVGTTDYTLTLQPSATMTENTTYTFPTAYPGGSGYVLTSATDGVLSWSASGTGGIGDITTVGSCTSGDCFVDGTNNSLTFEGATNDTYEIILQAADATLSDKTITLPDATGTLALGTGTNGYNAYWTGTSTLGSEQYVSMTQGGTGINTSASTGVPTISAGTWSVASSLGIALGGTNAATIGSAGSVPYSTGTAYAFSAVGTTGQALISGGTGSPTWYTPTAGSILFAGTGGILTQDNANFFWDNTNKRLGIGTAAPSAGLAVSTIPTGSGVSQGALYVNPSQMSSASAVSWSVKSAWNAPDVGNYTKPAFADLDNDGDQDLLIGERYGACYAYENTGSETSPVWTAKSAWDTPDVGDNSAPIFADLDNDGDYDLLIGEAYGVSYAYENTGSATSPTWTAKPAWNTPDVGFYSIPIFADLDNDGDYDLLIGAQNGISYGYENTGSATSPTWTARPTWNTPDVGNYAFPAFADFDSDGDYDLLIGNSDASLYGYENTGTVFSPVWTAKSAWNAPDVGSYANPALADLDNDGDHDLLIGETGGISFGYENTGSGGAVSNTLLGLAVNGSEKFRVNGSGSIITNGLLDLNSYLDLDYAGTSAAASITQTGLGDILNLFDGSTEVLTVLDGGNVGIGTTAPLAKLHVQQTATAAGALKGIIYTGAVNTNQTASTEIPSLTLTTAGREWATGALATQREVLITAPTYSFVGASTITDAATLAIAGAPIKSTNATITNTHGLLIQAVAVSTATNSYGLTVNAQTGATNNYAAAFLNGNVGIGDTSPASLLTVGNGDLFQVDSNGDIVKLKNVTYSWPSSQAGGSGYVLTNNGSGTLSWSATAAATAHALLNSSFHSDTTTGTVVRGDIVTGQGVSPTWTKLALGTSGQYLRSDGTDAAWSGILEGDLPATLTRDSEWDTQGEAETIWGATLATDSELSTHAALAAGVHGAAGTIVGTSDAQTLTNKTLSTGSTWNGNVITTAYGGTGLAAYTAGDMLYYSSGTALTKLAVGADGQVLVISAGVPTWSSTAPGAAHNLLSSSHADTTAGAVVRGDIVTGQGVSPTWTKLALGTSGKILRSDGTDALWSTATYPDTITSGYILYGSGANVVGSEQYVTNAQGGTGINTSASTGVPTISAGTWSVASSLGIALGGTNAATIGSAGSVPYSTGTAYAFSAVGTTGQALISGGTGSPTWFAPTAGSILFAGTGGILTQDNANFFWDDTNNRLGIGTNSPNNTIQVADLINFYNTDYNTSLGYQAGKNVVSGAQYNTFLGHQAGLSSAAGSTIVADYNTAIGFQSLFSNTTGHSNSAVGINALYSNTTGYYNSAVGKNALTSNTSGHSNSAMGTNALYSNTAGYYNSAMGMNALLQNQTGSANTVLGMEAGYGVAGNSFASSTLIGYQAGYGLTTGNNNILIGYQAGDSISSASDNTIIGYQAGQAQTTATRNTFLGYQAGYVNTASDNTFIGYGAGDSNTSALYNTFVGVSAGQANVTGTRNTFLGYQAGYLNTVSDNTFIGYQAGDSNTSAVYNTFVGVSAGQANTIGASNLALGYQSLYSNTEGYYNSALGMQALYANTTGYHNSALGQQALYTNTTGYYNTALGQQALFSNTTGTFNSALGMQALYANTTGTYNTALGTHALLGLTGTYNYNVAMGYLAGSFQADGLTYLTTPSQSIYIGSKAKGFNNSDVNAIVIGYNAVGIGANTVVLGNDSIVTTALKGNVGIGDTSPASLLTVGNGDLFQVDSNGDIVKLKNVTYSWPSSQAGGSGYVLTNNGSGTLSWSATAAATAHALLNSSFHSDTTTGTVVRGDIVTGQGVSPTWTKLALGTSGKILRSDGTDALWSTATYPDTITSGYILYGSGANVVGSEQYVTNAQGGTGINTSASTGVPTISAGTWSVASSLGIALGGTNAATIGSAGSVPYSTGTAYAFSAVGTTGQALISGGTESPTWYAPTAGSVLFAGTGGILQQDNSNFFWDDTNNRLGIGTITPSALLNLKGNLSSALTGTVAVTNLSTAVVGTGTLFTTELAVGDSIKIQSEIFTVSAITDALNLTLDSAYQGATASGLTAYRDPTLFAIDNGDAVNKLTITKSGNVGIGTAAPTNSLHIYAGDPDLTLEFNTSPTGSFSALQFADAGTTGARLGYNRTTEVLDIVGDYDADAIGDVRILTGSNERLIVKNSGNVGIGTTDPGQQLEITGNFKLPTTTATTGIIYAGTNRFIHNYGTSNFFAGVNAGNLTMTGTGFNVAVGANALLYNTSGNSNSVIGYEALTSNSSGNANTAMGFKALYSLTGAYSNNAALGHQAGRYQADGSTPLTSASQSVYIGSGVMGYNNSDVNSIVIGYQAKGIGANTVVLGNDSIVTTALKGNVGIGTTGPDRKLDILDASNPQLRLTHTDGSIYSEFQTGANGGVAITSSNLTANNAIGLSSAFTITNATGSASQYGEKLVVTSTGGTAATLYGKHISFVDATTTANTVYGLYVNASTANANDTQYAAAFMNGNVGIGTTSPGAKLDLKDGDFFLTDADVTHGVTDSSLTTNTYGGLQIDSATDGGLRVWGIGDTVGQRGLVNLGILGSADPTDTVAAVTLGAGKKNGTTIQAIGSLETALKVENWGTALVTVLGGGNVGIGTTSPSNKLEVVRANGAAIAALSGAAGSWTSVDIGRTATELHLGVASSANQFFNSTAAGDAAVRLIDTSKKLHLGVDGGTNKAEMTIIDGAVGIGTVSPAELLEVSADAQGEGVRIGGFELAVRRTGSLDEAMIHPTGSDRNSIFSSIPTGTGDGYIDIFATDYVADSSNYERIMIHAGTTNEIYSDALGSGTKRDLSIYASSAGQLYLSTTGNVGIGDTSPDSIFDILSSSAANTQLTMTNTNAGDYDTQIGFQLAEGTNLFTMGVDDSDSDKFKISTTALGTNDRFVIDSSGKIGINTDPDSGTIVRVGASGSVNGLFGFTDTGYGLQGYANSSGEGVVGYSASGNAIRAVTGSGKAFKAEGGTGYDFYGEGLKSYFAGKVGIGLISPSAKLDIDYNESTATAGNYYGLRSDSDSIGIFTTGTTNYYGIYGDAAATGVSTGGTVNTYGGYFTAAGEATGAAATNAYGLFVGNVSGADNNYSAVFWSGNVGIGTTGPGYPLEINPADVAGASWGNGLLGLVGQHNTVNRPYLYLKNKDAGTTFTGGIRWIDGNGNTGYSIDNNLLINNGLEFNINGVNKILFSNSGGIAIGYTDTGTAALAINGNVGIGTATPGNNKLAIEGDSAGRVTTWVGNINATSKSAALALSANSTAGEWEIGTDWDADGGDNFYVWGGGSGDVRLFIDSSGNVGINTASFGTNAAGALAITGSTAPTTSITDGIQLFAVDVAGSHELQVRDEAGNVTTLSPHNFSIIPEGPSEDLAWSFYSERQNKAINVDMAKTVRLVEQLTGQQLIYLKDLEKDKYLNENIETEPLLALEAINDIQTQSANLQAQNDSLILKTNENIDSLEELQDSVDEQLAKIELRISNYELRINDLEVKDMEQETRITSIETLATTLQAQIDELKQLTNQELNLAQIDLNKNDIAYLKTLLGIDRAKNPGDVSLLGKLEADGVVAGAFTVKVVDEEKKTIGEAEIKNGEKEVFVETKAVSETAKIFTSFVDNPGAYSWVEKVKDADGNYTGFKVMLSEPVTKDVGVNWWIVESR